MRMESVFCNLFQKNEQLSYMSRIAKRMLFS